MDLEAQFNVWLADTIAFLPNLLLIVVISLLTRIVARRIDGIVRRLCERTKAPLEISALLGRVARVGTWLVGVLLVLGQLGLSSAVTGFVAGLGISGLIIGFALQDIVKQFASGVLLLMTRPFRVGDYIKVGVHEGAVYEIQIRATVLKTAEGDEVLIPNADVYTSAIINRSRYALRRRVLALHVPRASDVEGTRAALQRAVQAVPGVAAHPPAAVISTGLADANVVLEARFWVDQHATDADAVATAVVNVCEAVLAGAAETQAAAQPAA